MSDSTDYLMAHARTATLQARKMPFGRPREQMRRVARVYHLLAKQGDFIDNAELVDDYRTARHAELKLLANRDYWLF